jgi:hypothetical protein
MSTSLTAILVAVCVMAIAAAAYVAARTRMLHWGATTMEARRSMRGDDLIPEPILVTTRAITIDAEAERVWPWLSQIGQGRGGFYSYELLENLAGLDIHNADRIIPEMQELKPGDLIPFWRGAGVNVETVKAPRLLVLAGTLNRPRGGTAAAGNLGGTWVFALEDAEPRGTRLVVRSRVAKFEPAWLSALFMRLLEPVHYVMEHKMLKGIRDRAEQH